jgi:hypothetical protein
MTTEAVTKFLKTIAADGRVQRDFVEFAAEHGYQFTLDELRERIPAGSRVGDRDRHPDQVRAVTGGVANNKVVKKTSALDP